MKTIVQSIPKSPNAKAEDNRVMFDVLGMTCASCAGRVERAVQHVPGVQTAQVNLATEKATVGFDSTQTSLDAIRKAVHEAGYETAIPSSSDPLMPRQRRANWSGRR